MAAGIRTQLVELWSRLTPYKKSDQVFSNGENNQYPNEIEAVVMNSPTASRAKKIFSKYIFGGGLAAENPELSKTVKAVCNDVALQYGSWIHVSYKIDPASGNIVPAGVKSLNYLNCRIDKPDDNDNSGRIRYKDFSKGKYQSKWHWYYPFSNDQNVIKAQILADGKLAKKTSDISIIEALPYYRGQVYYLNLTPEYTYAISPFDPVYNDCDTEYRMSLYSNTMTREGFLGKMAVILNNLDEETSSDVKRDIQNWLGADKSGGAYVLEMVGAGDLENIMKIVNVPSQYNDDMFVNTEKRIRRNILGAANNVPEGLIFSNESGGLFAAGGEQFREMKRFYSEQTRGERDEVEAAFKEIGFPIKLIPLGQNDTGNNKI